MVEVFKTNVEDAEQASGLLAILVKAFPGLQINFDLEDCDKVLRVEGIFIQAEKIMEILLVRNFTCEVLE